jgi:hypothetical protein
MEVKWMIKRGKDPKKLPRRERYREQYPVSRNFVVPVEKWLIS